MILEEMKIYLMTSVKMSKIILTKLKSEQIRWNLWNRIFFTKWKFNYWATNDMWPSVFILFLGHNC